MPALPDGHHTEGNSVKKPRLEQMKEWPEVGIDSSLHAQIPRQPLMSATSKRKEMDATRLERLRYLT